MSNDFNALEPEGKIFQLLLDVLSISSSIKTTTIWEDFFFNQEAFSYEDYTTFAASETKTIIVDPTAFIPDGKGVLKRIPFLPMSAYSPSGPIRVQFYQDSIADDDGTLLEASNRDSSAEKIIPDLKLRLDPSNITKGTRFAGDLIPSSDSGPGGLNTVGGSNAPGLPFAITNLKKYAIDLTNDNGDNVLVQIKLTWFETLM